MTLSLVAVTIQSIEANLSTWIEYYWAEDLRHAKEQAKNAHPDEDILCAAWVPYNPHKPDNVR